ncbi:hypothetical protein ACOMHN_030426 [Nucella lapillus]
MAGPEGKRALLVCLTALVCIHSCLCWSGEVCQNIESSYVTKRVCTYSTWLGCCAYKTIRVPQIRINRFCCPGWTHKGDQRCNVPVCNPSCMNGGTCSQPGKCSCLQQFSGPRCGQSQCSHIDPCYPGACEPGSTQCSCTERFSDNGRLRVNRCLKLEKAPEIFQMRARMSYWGPMNGKNMEMYSLLSDSSGKDDADFIWTSRKKFNSLMLNASSQFSMPGVPPRPEYVSNSELGIVGAQFTIVLTKDQHCVSRRRRRSENRYVSQNDTMQCEPRMSFNQPTTGLLTCGLAPRYDRLLETGDILTITFTATSGGFRQLKDLNTGQVKRAQQFVGRGLESSVQFRFDLQPPYHCSERKGCSGDATPLSVQDLTKDPLSIRWGGWKDDLSGMYRYNMEVFPLNHTAQGTLEILRPLNPIFSKPIRHADLGSPVTYKPPGPGMLAVILEVADLANNTRFFRRLALYDPRSEVTADPSRQLFFLSASPAANYSYQNDTGRALVVTWEGVFRNALHEDLRMLGSVRPYPPQLEDYRKNIPPDQDDREGPRTVNAIENKRGIVNFELAYQKLSQVRLQDGDLALPPPSVPWRPMNLTLHHTVLVSVADGDTVIAWVRATDVMDNHLVRRTEVTFDTTEAEVGQLTFHMNEAVEGIPFSSRFALAAKDIESGVAQVTWIFKRSNGTVLYTDTVRGRRVQSCGSGQFQTCYCTPRDLCYLIDNSYAVSNCHMMVEKEALATEVISVQVEISNAAGLITTRNMRKGQLTMLNGTEAYYPPQHVRTESVGQTRATVVWDFPPSCYERTDLWVVVPDANGQEVMRPVHKDAARYDVVDLHPGRHYTVQLIARYSGLVKSDPRLFTFRTAEPSGLTGGETAGIAVGVLLLLLLLVVILVAVVVARRGLPRGLQGGRLENLRNSLKGRGQAGSSRYVPASDPGHMDASASFVNTPGTASDPEAEDLYLTACQTWQERRPWVVDAGSLVLQNQLAEGKFADIYSAAWSKADSASAGKHSTTLTVAAKILKSGFSRDDANKLMRKIQFSADQDISHDNVLRFLGAVLDNKHLGPVMMVEYCEGGQLDNWLRGKRGDVTEDTMDTLFRFAKDVACGMECLTARGIVHSRLAARNVLLTFLLEVKVAGFGPPDVSVGKVAAKWAAPEILQENPATERSDVWAYGVTLWELFSMGQSPYPDSPYPDVRGTEMGPYLKSGQRLDKPEYADDMFYKLMQNCWRQKPGSRPSFSEVKQQLCALFQPKARNSHDLYYYDATQLKK